MRTKALLLLMMGSAVAAVLPVMTAADAAGPEHATIANFSFSPNPVSIPLGATLEWTNTDGTGHTITADDGSFSSGTLARDAKFSHTFDQPGPVAYHCSIHPSMKGTVSVEAPPTTAPPTTTTTAAPTTTTAKPTTTTAAPPTTTTAAAGTTATAAPASPRPTTPKAAPSSTTRATAAPTTTAPAVATPAPTVAAPTIDAQSPETTATAPLPEQAAPPAESALDTPSGESGNGGAVGFGAAVAAVLLLGGGGFWVWRRRISAG